MVSGGGGGAWFLRPPKASVWFSGLQTDDEQGTGIGEGAAGQGTKEWEHEGREGDMF